MGTKRRMVDNVQRYREVTEGKKDIWSSKSFNRINALGSGVVRGSRTTTRSGKSLASGHSVAPPPAPASAQEAWPTTFCSCRLRRRASCSCRSSSLREAGGTGCEEGREGVYLAQCSHPWAEGQHHPMWVRVMEREVPPRVSVGSLPPDTSCGRGFPLPRSGSEMQFKNSEDRSFSSGFPECTPSPAV